ncbi:hypothetical protein ANCDUO_14039 [Ancylostoma duodenale]|uniref:Uncharacterized protein n=1 Tax=Ancylostoma duodenale TaxID=51022 RepID=A0A0C2CHE4_9BILA|nr:hypothetical protein ANCDUO_14039 [Ancylostoma duodenale]
MPYVGIGAQQDNVHETISSDLISNINPENIKANLRKFTKDPHLAGTEANKRVAHEIAQLWIDAGLEVAGHQWLAYSASGKVSADVVYCNRGLQQDFDNLKRMNIDMKVCL